MSTSFLNVLDFSYVHDVCDVLEVFHVYGVSDLCYVHNVIDTHDIYHAHYGLDVQDDGDIHEIFNKNLIFARSRGVW